MSVDKNNNNNNNSVDQNRNGEVSNGLGVGAGNGIVNEGFVDDNNGDDRHPELNINRKAYNVPHFNRAYERVISAISGKTVGQRLARMAPDFSRKAWIDRLKSLFPILTWLPQYNLRQYLLVDILVGITVAIFTVPQGMGYALTAHLHPVYGIYSAFFPPLFYIFMGCGKHVSVGTFAITSGLMTGEIIVTVKRELGLTATGLRPNSTTTAAVLDSRYSDIESIDIAVMVCLIIGLYMAAFGVLQLGFISNFLPQELISGFITAATVITMTSQVRYMLGVSLSNYTGALAFPMSWIEIFARLDETNIGALVISVVCLAVLVFVKFYVDGRLKERGVKFPIPIDLIILVVVTVVSSQASLNETYGVDVVGSIPMGFPAPVMPKLKLLPYLWSRCIPVAIVSYVTTVSVGKVYAAQHDYRIEDNQELLALGVTNIGSAFFLCLPSAASLPRSALASTSGGKSQVVFISNCLCLVAVIISFGSLFEQLPTAVLGSCITIALLSLMMKITDFWRFWTVSKLDGALWMITFLAVLLLDIDYGIYIGFGCSLLILIYKSQRPKTYILGSVAESEIYVPINKYSRAKEIPNIKIYQFCGPLNFANVEYFQNDLKEKSGIDVDAAKIARKKLIAAQQQKSKTIGGNCSQKLSAFTVADLNPKFRKMSLTLEQLPIHIVIDCSSFSYIDTSGVNALKSVVKRHEEIGVNTVLSGCHVHVERKLEVVGFFDELSPDHVYKCIHDAVIHCVRDDQRLLDRRQSMVSFRL